MDIIGNGWEGGDVVSQLAVSKSVIKEGGNSASPTVKERGGKTLFTTPTYYVIGNLDAFTANSEQGTTIRKFEQKKVLECRNESQGLGLGRE